MNQFECFVEELKGFGVDIEYVDEEEQQQEQQEQEEEENEDNNRANSGE